MKNWTILGVILLVIWIAAHVVYPEVWFLKACSGAAVVWILGCYKLAGK